MTIRELQYKIQDAIDGYGTPDDSKVVVGRGEDGKAAIRAEFGCGFYLLGDGIPLAGEDEGKTALVAAVRATIYYLENLGCFEENYELLGEDAPSVILHRKLKDTLRAVGEEV